MQNTIYQNELSSCFRKNNFNIENISNQLIEIFYKEIVTEQSQQIIDIAFNDDLTQKTIDVFFQKWDIEENTAHRAMLVAYTMKEKPSLIFPDSVTPRLNGLLLNHRFKNLQLIAHFTKITKALNDAGIKPLILKGGAMKYLRQNLPRIMGDIDILIHQNEYPAACNIAHSLGYFFIEKNEMHAIDLHTSPEAEDGILDIHRWLDFMSDYDHKFTDTFFERAELKKIFGADVYLPCAEDMLFIALVNMSKNLTRKTSMNGILYTLFDCKYLLKTHPNFNWDIVVNNAVATNTQLSLYFAMNFVNRIVPGLLPTMFIENKTIKDNFANYCYKLMYYRYYLDEIRQTCRQIKIKKALINFSTMKQYLRYKPKYVALKSIRNNPWAIKKLFEYISKNKG